MPHVKPAANHFPKKISSLPVSPPSSVIFLCSKMSLKCEWVCVHGVIWLRLLCRWCSSCAWEQDLSLRVFFFPTMQKRRKGHVRSYKWVVWVSACTQECEASTVKRSCNVTPPLPGRDTETIWHISAGENSSPSSSSLFSNALLSQLRF